MPSSLQLLDVLTRFILPPILGGAGGYLAAWIGWDIEKRRSRRTRRQALVDQWRKEIFEDWPEGGVDAYGGSQSRWLMTMPAFRSLQPHLSEDFVGQLSGDAINVHRGAVDALGQMLAVEIARIEREWDLV